MNKPMQRKDKRMYHWVVILFGFTVGSRVVAPVPVRTAGVRDFPTPPF